MSQAAIDMDSGLKLEGRVALVTGAAKRLGRYVASHLASEGADIAVHYGKSETEARTLVEEIERQGRRAAAFSADLTNVEAIPCLIEQVAGHFGRLDILINSAANFLQAKFGETTRESWDASLDTNLRAPFFCAQAAAPYLAKSGKGIIINFADIGGLLGWPEFLPHCISKSGVILMTRALARELAPNIRVNAVAPGLVSLPEDPPEWDRNYSQRAPLKRSGRPREIADAVTFLINLEFATGQVLVLDGGRSL
jgi:NAD(P)-dependent dehydrogenase (short-subunit alcohol dehydrogenase family)